MVNTAPKVFVTFEDSEWPPAEGEYPAGSGSVVRFSSDRELASPILAGQLAGAGSSVGRAQLSIGQSRGKRLAPWGKGDRKVTNGTTAHIFTSDSPTGSIFDDLGFWIVAGVGGSLVNGAVQLDVREPSRNAKVANLLRPFISRGTYRVEAAAAVDNLARQAGYYTTPAPTPHTVMSIPLQGTYQAEKGTTQFVSAYPTGWDDSLGLVSPVGGLTAFYHMPDSETFTLPITIVATVTGTVTFWLGSETDADNWATVEIRPSGVFALRKDSADAWSTGSYTPGLDANHPNRVEFEVSISGTTLSAKARSSAAAAWSTPITRTVPGGYQTVGDGVSLRMTAGSAAAGVLVSTTSDAGSWAVPNATIPPLGSLLSAVYLPTATYIWDGIQEITQALGAAAVLRDEGKSLEVLPFGRMRGAAPSLEPIDVGFAVEDLPWQIDSSSQADRLEFTYHPASVQFSSALSAPDVWTAEDVYEIPPFGSISVNADLQGAASVAPWVEHSDTSDWPTEKESRWAANTARDGTGSVAASSSLTLRSIYQSSGRVVISITNNTGTTLYTVDPNGNPYLRLRADAYAPQTEAAVVALGVSAEESTNTLTVDAGRWVQDAETAAKWAGVYWSVASQPAYSVNGIRCLPDISRQLGDLIPLFHVRSDLDTKAIITGIHDTFEAGKHEQLIDVVRLPPTFYDWNTILAGKTFGDWNAATVGVTFGEFNDDALPILRSN